MSYGLEVITALFLRRVNVSGSRVKMADLRETLANVGYPNSRTILASGNVVIDSQKVVDIRAIEVAIEAEYGFHSEIFSRTAPEVASLAAANPFRDREGTIELAFLHTPPSRDVIRAVEALATGRDDLAIIDRELWWFRPHPLEESFPKETAVRKVLGTTTRRGYRTIERVLDVIEEMDR